MSDLAKQLGRRIYGFRKSNQLTQAGLAERARISNEFMSAIERGAKLPSLPALERIALGLRVGMKDLLNFDRANYHKSESLAREVLDIALVLQQLPVDERRRIVRMVKIFIRAKS